MLEELNELVEGMIIDITSEGMGTTIGVALMWGMFFGGTFVYKTYAVAFFYCVEVTHGADKGND